jgi:hypothetical protein
MMSYCYKGKLLHTSISSDSVRSSPEGMCTMAKFKQIYAMYLTEKIQAESPNIDVNIGEIFLEGRKKFTVATCADEEGITIICVFDRQNKCSLILN